MSSKTQKIKDLINQDGGKVSQVNLFGDVLIIRASMDSRDQLERFLKVGLKNNLLINGEIEELRGKLVLSSLIVAQE